MINLIKCLAVTLCLGLSLGCEQSNLDKAPGKSRYQEIDWEKLKRTGYVTINGSKPGARVANGLEYFWRDGWQTCLDPDGTVTLIANIKNISGQTMIAEMNFSFQGSLEIISATATNGSLQTYTSSYSHSAYWSNENFGPNRVAWVSFKLRFGTISGESQAVMFKDASDVISSCERTAKNVVNGYSCTGTVFPPCPPYCAVCN